MDSQLKKIATWVMIIALLAGSILVDYSKPLFSNARENAVTIDSNQENQQEHNETNSSSQEGQSENPDTENPKKNEEENHIEKKNEKKDEPQENANDPEENKNEQDITKYANVRLGSFSIDKKSYTVSENGQIIDENGQVVTEIEANYNTNIRMKWLWNISEKDMDKVSKGKFIKIKLPDNLSNSNLPVEFKDSQNARLGEFAVKDKHLVATFTEDSYEMDYLEDGFFEIVESVKAQTTEILDTVHHTEKESFVLKINPKPAGPSKPIFNPASFNRIFHKSGGQSGWTERINSVYYLFRVNHDKVDEIYAQKPVQTVHNVVLEDFDFPTGLQIDTDKIEIKVPMFAAATSDPQLASNHIMEYFWVYKPNAGLEKLRNNFRLIDEAQDLNKEHLRTKDNFKAYVEAEFKKGSNNGKPIIGVWDKRYLVVALGNLPSNTLKYKDVSVHSDRDTIGTQARIDGLLRNGVINNEQEATLRRVYNEENPITFLNITIIAKLTNPNKTEFENTAYLHYDSITVSSETTIQNVKHLRGGAQGGVAFQDITVNKVWSGGSLPQVNLKLIAKTEGKADVATPFTLSEGNWTKTFKGLRGKDPHTRKPIHYSVIEEKVEGYSTDYKDPIYDSKGNITFTVQNIKEEVNIPKLSIPVTKVWKDAQGGTITPEASQKVSIRLMQNGQLKDTVTLPHNGSWSYEFTGLDKQDKEGNLYQYTVEEEQVTGYTKSVTQNNNDDVTKGFTVTNTKTPERVNIQITKKWTDINNQPITAEDKLPEGVKFEVLANGKRTKFVYVTKASAWIYSEPFEKLDKNGREIVYSIKEVELTGYRASIAQQAGEYNFVVTNKKTPTPPAPYIPPYIPNDPITLPPDVVVPPLPKKPVNRIVIEDDEVALANYEEEPVEDEFEEEAIEEPSEEEINDELPKANKDVPKTHDFLMNGFANPLAVGSVLMMGYGVKQLIAKKRNKK